MEKIWRIKAAGDDREVEHLSNVLGIAPSLSNLLVQRGIKTFDQAKSFFRPTLAELHDPYLMKDMDLAVQRIDKAIRNKERIMIYGDYDVDGTTSVALVYSFLSKYYSNLDYYIPDRYTEGYGISYKGIDYANNNDISLVIALDCGIKAIEKIKYANRRNIDFIICDHHTPGNTIPDALAVLDPKRPDCEYPFKELSGCGVGFKLIQALAMSRNIDFEELEPYLDLVVVSIASDIVPITGENRIMAYYGLRQLNSEPRLGLKIIIDVAGITGKDITITDIVFKIGPRINAAGRMESGNQAVELLVTDDAGLAFSKGEQINAFNNRRRDIDHTITEQALELISSTPELRNKRSTVLFNASWHKGVVGIVASRLVETFYRPTIILTESNGFASGSARSVIGFDLYAAISECEDLLESFGGHMYAAGLTLKLENVPLLMERFEKIVNENITTEQLQPQIEIDAGLELKDITPKFYRILKQFEPFGPGNMPPVFFTEDVVDNGEGRIVGSTKEHLKLSLIQEENPFQAVPGIAFNQAHHFHLLKKGIPFDIAYSIAENDYLGQKTLQLNIKDIKED
jgi:single-stranded-DNA-specific exonuclease